MADTAYERVLCVKNEVLVYRIPPRPSNRGFRANDWKLDAPDWTGRLRVVSKNNELLIKLEDKSNGELFAQCPVDSYPSIAVEPVMDSSRYFVIRIKDEGGRSAFIGIGFYDRADSFDLNVSLQDHFKWLKQEAEEAKSAKTLDAGPKLDLGFKEGQTITLNLGTKKGDARPRNKPASSGTGISPLPPPPGGIKLPPPTSSLPKVSPPSLLTQNADLLPGVDPLPSSASQGNSSASQNPPDLWGDFTAAGGAPAPASSESNNGNWIQF